MSEGGKSVFASKKDSSIIPERQMIEQIKDKNPELWNEVAEFNALLREWGFTGYRLTGPVEEPIVVSYKFSGG